MIAPTFSTDIATTRRMLDRKLRIDESFDLVRRDVIVCEKQCSFYFVDGMVKDESLLKIMDSFMKLQSFRPNTFADLKTFYDTYIPYVETEDTGDPARVAAAVLSGMCAMVVDGLSGAILIDARTYPVRSIKEPDNDKVLRGARVGFVETLVFNTALIRRHIRDEALTMKIKSVGESSKTDIVLCYMDGKADEKYLKKLEAAIDAIRVPALSLGHESLAECLIKKKWYNPFPKIRYTERPDTAAASLMEGNILILCDNSPSAMILPTSIFDFLQEADDYYFTPITGTYLRLIRSVVFFFTIYLTPIWYLLIKNEQFIPSYLSFIKVESNDGLPILLQLFILEFAIDGLKLAAMNTPDVLSGSFSIIGGLILGDYAIKIGWFVPETIFYMAFVAIANFSQPSYELGYAFKYMRLLMLALIAFLNIWGFILANLVMILLIATNATVAGSKSYLYPLIPFNARALGRMLIRQKLK